MKGLIAFLVLVIVFMVVDYLLLHLLTTKPRTKCENAIEKLGHPEKLDGAIVLSDVCGSAAKNWGFALGIYTHFGRDKNVIFGKMNSQVLGNKMNRCNSISGLGV